jgi:hypothetical protein
VQEEIQPGPGIALVKWRLDAFCLIGLRRLCRTVFRNMCQRHGLGYEQLLLARCRQPEVLPGRQLEILRSIVILVLKPLIGVLQPLDLILLAQLRDMLLQLVIGMDDLHPAPADEQDDYHESDLREHAHILEPVQMVLVFIDLVKHLVTVYRLCLKGCITIFIDVLLYFTLLITD